MPLLLPVARCALTAPFHPYRVTSDRRYIFCGTFRRLTPPRRYLAPCPMEPGLSSILSCDKTATAQPTLSVCSISQLFTRIMMHANFIGKNNQKQSIALTAILSVFLLLHIQCCLIQQFFSNSGNFYSHCNRGLNRTFSQQNTSVFFPAQG